MSDLSGGALFLEPVSVDPTPPPLAVAHHPQSDPSAYLCTCGKIREACVHDEIRAFWSAVSAPDAKQPPKPE